jgi:hypothetical protein
VIQFQIGSTYQVRSLSDYDCVWDFVILGRTARTVTIIVNHEAVKRGIKVRNGVESFKPFGTYSMNPVVYANAKSEGSL